MVLHEGAVSLNVVKSGGCSRCEYNKRLQLSKALGTALADVTLRYKPAVHGQGRAKHLRS